MTWNNIWCVKSGYRRSVATTNLTFNLQADLEVLIANVLDVWAKIDPNRMIDKMKLHVLTHLPEDIRRFGPAGLYIVEGFEGWNRIWRLCSILSNHHSPSRDIAVKLCKAERVKHLLSGGFWRDKDSKRYVQAGKGVQDLFTSDQKLRRRLGWSQPPGSAPGTSASQIEHRSSHSDPTASISGSVNLVPAKNQPSGVTWDELFDSNTIPPQCPDGFSADDRLLLGETVVAASGDICKAGSWVFYRSPFVRHVIPFSHRITRLQIVIDGEARLRRGGGVDSLSHHGGTCL